MRSPFHNKIYNLVEWSHLVSLSRPSRFSQNEVPRYACACQLNSCNQLIPPPEKNSDSITHAQSSKKIKKDVADFWNSQIHWKWQRRYDRSKCCEIKVDKWRDRSLLDTLLKIKVSMEFRNLSLSVHKSRRYEEVRRTLGKVISRKSRVFQYKMFP